MFSSLHKIHIILSPLLLVVASMLATLFTVPLRAASLRPDSIRYEAELYATSSTGANTPFWLISNRQGLGSPKSNFGYVRTAVFKDLDKEERFSWGAGIDLVGAWRYSAPFHIHQLYAEMKYRSLEIMAGSKEMWCAHNDPKLSSGSLLFSGNALPIPQVRIGIFDYAPFWGTKGWLAVKGYIAYGIFSDSKWQKSWAATGSKYTQNVLFHSKGLWLRFGNPAISPVTGDVGIEMATQFGGTAYKDGKIIRKKHGLKEWWRAFFPVYKTHHSFNGDIPSVEGNMLGQYTIGIQWKAKNIDWKVRGYFEHFFEDQSMMTFEYGWQDGLWGIESQVPKNRFVSKIVYEFLYSKDQAGAVNHDKTPEIPEQVSGRDEYYNHSFYSGWHHWGLGIGNPLMISPIYNADNAIRFSSTRIIGHHFAIAGQPSEEFDYRLLFSHTKSWGTYDRPLPKVMTNINGLIELNWHIKSLKGWYWSIGFAFDRGDLLGNSFGLGITIGKMGLFKF